MPDQPLAYRTAEEVLDRAMALFTMADAEVRAGLDGPPKGAWQDQKEDGWGYVPYDRAKVLAAVASAGARVAHALIAYGADTEIIVGDPPERVLAALRAHTDGGYLDRLERWRDDIADAARVATDGFKAPEVAGPAAAEVQRLLREVPYRDDGDNLGG
jgi:hypothetical protein